MEQRNYEEFKEWLQERIRGWLSDYEGVREAMFLRVRNAARNRPLLEQAPYTGIEDLAITYHVRLEVPGEGLTSILLTHELIRQCGFPCERIRGDAFRSSRKLFPPEVDTMENVMNSLLIGDGSCRLYRRPPDAVPALMVTNTEKVNGAAALFYPGVMEEVADRLGGDFFVLPSSIHEVIALPADRKDDWRDLEKMVRSINRAQVAPDEQLSDHVYHYDSAAHIFERADRAFCGGNRR